MAKSKADLATDVCAIFAHEGYPIYIKRLLGSDCFGTDSVVEVYHGGRTVTGIHVYATPEVYMEQTNLSLDEWHEWTSGGWRECGDWMVRQSLKYVTVAAKF